MSNRIVFEDENLILYSQSGAREDAGVITFSEMLMRPHDNQIWAGRAIKKCDVPALGFVAKESNWFPKRSVENAINAARLGFESLPSTVIGYGFSMGAYAILKYSKPLNISISLCVCPQLSIDPADITDNRFNRHFTEDNRGMALTSKDGAQRNVIVADMKHPPDQKHALEIAKRINSEIVSLPYSGHASVRALSSSEWFERMITLAMSPDIKELKDHIRSRRRFANERPLQIAHAAASRHPDLAWAIFSKYEQAMHPKVIPALMFKFNDTQYRENAIDALLDYTSSYPLAWEGHYVLSLLYQKDGEHLLALPPALRAVELNESAQTLSLVQNLKSTCHSP